MFRVGAAIGALILIAAVASAVNGQEQEAPNRFQLTTEGDGFLRLDTVTGALSFCAVAEGRWVCQPVDSANATTDALADLSVRLSALESRLTTLAERVPAPVIDLAPLTERLTAIENRLADPALAGTIDALVETQAAIQAAIANLASSVPPDFEAMELRLDVLAAEIETLAEAPGRNAGVFDERLAALADGQADLAEAIANLPAAPAADLRAIEARLDELVLRLDTVEAGVSALSNAQPDYGVVRRLDQIAETQAGLQLAFAQLLDAPDVGLTAIETRLDALTARMAVLVTAIEENSAPAFPDLVDLENRLDDLSAQLTALTVGLNRPELPATTRAEFDLAPLEQRLDALAGRIDEMGTALAAEPAVSLDAIEAGLTAIVETQNALREALSEISEEPTSNFTALQQQVDELADGIEALALLAVSDEPAAPDATLMDGARLADGQAEIRAQLEALLEARDVSDIDGADAAAIDGLALRLAAVESALAGLIERPMPDSSASIDGLRQAIEALAERQEALANEVFAVGIALMERADLRDGDLDDAVEEIRLALDETVADLATETSPGRVATQEAFQTLEGQLADLRAEVEALALSDLAPMLNEIVARQEDMRAELAAIADRLVAATGDTGLAVAPILTAAEDNDPPMLEEQLQPERESAENSLDANDDALMGGAEPATRSFGEEMVLRLHLLVGDLKRGGRAGE